MTLRATLDVAYVLWGEEVGFAALDAHLASLASMGEEPAPRSLEEDIEAWGTSPEAEAALRAFIGSERLEGP